MVASPAQEVLAGVLAGVAVSFPQLHATSLGCFVRRVHVIADGSGSPACARAASSSVFRAAQSQSWFLSTHIPPNPSQDALACHPVDVIKTQFHVNKGVNGSMWKDLVAQGAVTLHATHLKGKPVP